MKTVTETRTRVSSVSRHVIFFIALAAIIGAAIVRSNIATGLDSFTFDEGYHIGAGAVYVQTGDFRLNPEQPPLIKLWSGAYATYKGYKISPFRSFSDKGDERDFVEMDAYVNNDPFALQQWARTSMLALNALLMLLFSLAVWRVLGGVFALAATLFLAIDPTVAAHMPVVMTDLPIALTSATAIVLAARAFRTWNWLDLLLTVLATGLALSAKHSGIVTLAAIGVAGLSMALVFCRGAGLRTRLLHAGSVSAVIAGAIIVLWGSYGFHYRESPQTAEETFNRPLADKISDVISPTYRAGLNILDRGRLFPRAYVWGLADTIRAGAEGRAIQVRAFGNSYYARAPLYFFPGIVAAKLPIGLLVLAIAGIGLFIFGKAGADANPSLILISVCSLIFLAVLMTGSTYAGIRHALPLIPIAAIMASVMVFAAVRMHSRSFVVGVAALFVIAGISAIPQMRPWEYFNEMAGGAENGYKYFNDEGVDLSQRVGEMAAYYHAYLEPNGQVPAVFYFSNSRDVRSRGMDYVGRIPDRDDPVFDQETFTGTVMVGANELGEAIWWDVAKPFRGVEPVARLGNVFVFQGTFPMPRAAAARRLFYRTIYNKLYVEAPDLAAVADDLQRSLALDDSCYFVGLELGNVYLRLNDGDKAIEAYRRSLSKAPREDAIYNVIAQQIERLQTEPLNTISALRDPGLE